MTLRLLAVLALATFAACGADGPPERPASAASTSGLALSGCAEIGIATGPKAEGRPRC